MSRQDWPANSKDIYSL